MKNKYFNDAIIGGKDITASFTYHGEMLRLMHNTPDFKQFLDFFHTGVKINDSCIIYLHEDQNITPYMSLKDSVRSQYALFLCIIIQHILHREIILCMSSVAVIPNPFYHIFHKPFPLSKTRNQKTKWTIILPVACSIKNMRSVGFYFFSEMISLK